MSSTTPYKIKEPLWLALMVVLGILISGKFFPEKQNSLFLELDKSEESTQIGRVEELLRFIENRYVDDIDDDILLEKAINSIFVDLDPHSSYIPSERLQDVQDDMQASYQGIGITTSFRDDSLFVQSVMGDSPAEKAGFMIGDRILMINKQQISGASKNYADIRPILQFEDSSEHEFMINRGTQNVRVFLKPADVQNPAIDGAYMIEKGILYVKLSRFSDNVFREFMQVVESFEEVEKGLDLILDLRNNRGGYLPETVKILNQIFAEKDRLLVYTQDKTAKKIEYKSKGNRFYNIGKVAVLINENSASASEIIAGAIQDWDRGIIVGQPSFGKGLVQEQHKLSNGGAIRLTVARYYTPCGRSIQKPFKTEVVEQLVDTNVYRTLELKRKISGTGGIVPDFLVDEFSSTMDSKCQQVWLDLEYLIAKYRWRYDDDLSLGSRLETLQDAYELESSCMHSLSSKLEQLLLRNKSGQLVMLQAKNELDPVVLKAISQLKRDDFFSS